MKISTKGGDKGTTSLMFGRRVSKACQRVRTYGTIDELSASLAMARAFAKELPDEECDEKSNDLSPTKMLVLAIATSIDALAIGVTFAMINTNMFIAIPAIGICTFTFSFIGAIIGKKFGEKHRKKATLFGGLILIAMGIKILIEHLFF